MKRLIALALVLGLALSVSANAGVILVVSDSYAPDSAETDHRDDPLVGFLMSIGHTVDTSGMGGAFKDATNPFGDPAKVAAMDNADLVIVSRRTNSGAYDDNRKSWNEVSTPLLLMSGYLTRSSKWGWHKGGSANATNTVTGIDVEAGQEGHPFLAGLPNPVDVFDWTDAPTSGEAPKGVYLPNTDQPSAGTVIGKFDGRDALIDVLAGTDLDAFNGTTDKFGVTGARRAFLGHWGYDGALNYGDDDPRNRDADFDDFVTDQGALLMMNAINTLIPEPATIALLGFGGLALIRRKR